MSLNCENCGWPDRNAAREHDEAVRASERAKFPLALEDYEDQMGAGATNAEAWAVAEARLGAPVPSDLAVHDAAVRAARDLEWCEDCPCHSDDPAIRAALPAPAWEHDPKDRHAACRAALDATEDVSTGIVAATAFRAKTRKP